MKLKKINAYTVYANPTSRYYWLRLRLEGIEDEVVDLKVETLVELAAIAELLRNENNTLFDPETKNIVIGWETAGEFHPQH
jgi:hypothetical protein